MENHYRSVTFYVWVNISSHNPAQLCLNLFKNEFIEIATKLSAVVACRCSPTQKADVARLIRFHTKKRVCCIGDGGNDVSMIQAADVGKFMTLDYP